VKLRKRFAVVLGGAAFLVAIVGIVAVREARAVAQASDAAVAAQNAMLEARALVTLTFEFALHGQPRAAQQWRLRYDALANVLREAGAAHSDAPDLSGEVALLPGLFERLEQARRDAAADPIAPRRIELLTDNLIANTQTILDSTYEWVSALSHQRGASERRLAMVAITAPLLLLAVLALLRGMLSARVIGPLGRLQRMMGKAGSGDLSVRSGNTATDEIGELSRSFDTMTGSLERALAERIASERQLRLVADHLPARIARFDADQRCVFANRASCAALGVRDESELIGRTVRETRGDALYALFEPRIAAVLRGEPQSFALSESADAQGPRWSDMSFVPDRAEDGSVHGWYAMVQDVTETTRNRSRLELALAEKDVLLREVQHRVKNNLQVVTSLLSLQAAQTADPAQRASFDECRDRVRSMALVHDKLYHSEVLSAVDFADYLRTLVDMIAAAHRKEGVVAHVQAEPLQLDIQRAVPAGLIVNELVSNSFKHGFPAGRTGRIEASLHPVDGGRVQLRVYDDGVGAAGMDPLEMNTLGLRLVRLLAAQIDAQLHFGVTPGFDCTLEFAPSARVSAGDAYA